jgi:hypothetical protein
MKVICLAVIMSTFAVGAASAQQQPRRPILYAPGTTIGLGGAPIGLSRPDSPVSPSSGDVTHSDEQLRGLVPGNPAADGGVARNQGG